MPKRYQHLFFDMDNTLTPSRGEIPAATRNFLNALPHTVSVISGASAEKIKKQITGLEAHLLAQSGNHAILQGEKHLWTDSLPEVTKSEIHRHIKLLIAALPHDVPDVEDLVEDRGSQITLSIYGHNAPSEAKNRIDPNFELRKKLLKDIPFHSDTTEVHVTGSTCFDYTPKGKNKGSNIDRFIRHHGWKHDECIYFGDALFPGGNDHTVVGVIDTIMVQSYLDTYAKLLNMFGSET